ncbi:hypothetical protein CDAR_622021 [Caerostris darwini]|uniref:Tc1-like transposase DDE domain-containing protein n=1 Tax=Caerostris darwini TaxID=1538125 RepID=A0AAV4V3R0_9ARAC|nr:hypothetical protein CDAR_622021 [Caerostris darwini]
MPHFERLLVVFKLDKVRGFPKVRKCLGNKSMNLLDKPGNSPYMNPIEKIWELMKREINRAAITTTKQELIQELIDV